MRTWNCLRGDDAAGLEAVKLWQAQFPQSAGRVKIDTIELPGLRLLDFLEGMDAAILVDAISGVLRCWHDHSHWLSMNWRAFR